MHAQLVTQSDKFQTDQELVVIQDHDQHAVASNTTIELDINASNAQLDRFQTTKELNATHNHHVLDQIRSEELHRIATDVKLAHNNHTHLCQMVQETDVLELSQFAAAHRNTHQEDMIALTAQTDTLLIQITERDASQETVTQVTKSLEQDKTASDVAHAQLDTDQTHQELLVREFQKFATVLRSETPLVSGAYNAQHTKLPPTITEDACQDSAQELMRFSVMPGAAMRANHAPRDPPLTTWEEGAWDTSQHSALATKGSMNPDSDVLTAHLELDHRWITEAVSASTVTQTRSWEEICYAHNVNGAHQDPSQILRGRTVSSSQDQPFKSTVDQAVMNSQCSTLIELSASSAQATWSPQQTDWDAWIHALIHLTLFNKMVPASLAAMVTFQTTAEPDVSRRVSPILQDVPVKERSSTLTEPSAKLVDHTPELKEQTLSASQTNVMPVKSSLG